MVNIENMFSNMINAATRLYVICLVVGLGALLSGMFFLGNGPYKTFTYATLVVPSAFFMIFNWRQVLSEYTQGAVIWVFISLLFIALSALWSTGTIDIITAIRRCILYWVSGFGVFYLYHFHRSLFTSVLIIAGAVSALMTLLLMIDYYFLIDNSVSTRFMLGTMDYFDLYQGRGYGALYNPLLFSHLLVFYLVMAVMFLSSGWVLSRIQCVLLAVSSIIFIVALLASQTRMALGLFTFICAYSVIWHYKLKGAIVVALALISIVALVLTAGESLLERGLSYRWDIWKEVLTQVSERPYLGFGYGTDVVVSPKGINKTWYDSHNIYLTILYYSGYVGLSFVLVAFVLLYRESSDLSNNRYIFNLWLIVLIFGGFTDGDGLLSRPSVHWFNLVMPFLLMIAMIRSEKIAQCQRLKSIAIS